MTTLTIRRLDDAVRLLQQAAQLDPTNASYETKLAQTLARQGDDEAAAAALIRAGEVLLEKELWGEALDRLQAALKHEPANTSALVALPRAYRGLGREAEALAIECELLMRTRFSLTRLADMVRLSW